MYEEKKQERIPPRPNQRLWTGLLRSLMKVTTREVKFRDPNGRMVSSLVIGNGSLHDEVTDYLDNNPEPVVTATESWLTENITQPTTPVVDASLSVSGAAADAKATGDALENRPVVSATESAIQFTLGNMDLKAPTIENFNNQISELKSQITQLEAIPHEVKLAMDTLFSSALYSVDQNALATFHAWATAINVISISAVFEQGANAIHPNDSLDALKPYLTVTASYDDGTTGTVGDYELSGTLAEGTSTITVTYQDKTATFDVTVTSGIIYQLLNRTFTGDTSERIATDVTPLATDSDYTVAIDLVRDGNYTNNSYIFQCMEGVSPYYGFKMQATATSNNVVYRLISNGATQDDTYFKPSTAGALKVVIRHKAGDSYSTWSLIGTGTTAIDYNVGNTVKTITSKLYVCGNGFIGVLNSLTWYDYRFTDEQKNAFLGIES